MRGLNIITKLSTLQSQVLGTQLHFYLPIDILLLYFYPSILQPIKLFGDNFFFLGLMFCSIHQTLWLNSNMCLFNNLFFLSPPFLSSPPSPILSLHLRDRDSVSTMRLFCFLDLFRPPHPSFKKRFRICSNLVCGNINTDQYLYMCLHSLGF